jgi:hypothetical protein
MSLPQPTQLGNAYVVTFNGLDVPAATAAWMAKDGWKRMSGFDKKSKIEDLAGNPVNRLGAGAQIKYQGTVNFPSGTVAATPAIFTPGATFGMATVASGAASGSAVKYCIVSATLTGNREYDEVNMTVIKEASMTYA